MDKLRTVELYQDARRKIVAIESVELNQMKFKRGGHVNGSITPVAIVVYTSMGYEVLVVNKDETDPEQLKDIISELE